MNMEGSKTSSLSIREKILSRGYATRFPAKDSMERSRHFLVVQRGQIALRPKRRLCVFQLRALRGR